MKNCLTIALLMVSFTLDAFGCKAAGPFNINYKSKAEVVFKGQMIKYEYLKAHSIAKIRFRVLENLKGVSQKEWEVLYLGNTSGSLQ